MKRAIILIALVLALAVGAFPAAKTFLLPGAFSTADSWDGSTLPVAGDSLSITTSCTMTTDDPNIYGALTVQATGSLNVSSCALIVDAATVSGPLTMSKSASTGLVCSAFSASSSLSLGTGSKITITTGDFILSGSTMVNTYSGSWLFSQSSGAVTVDFGSSNPRLYQVTFSTAGATLNVASNARTEYLYGTGGTIKSNVTGTRRTIMPTNRATVSGITFKDISAGRERRIIAKNGCTNAGNCAGITFRDKVR